MKKIPGVKSSGGYNYPPAPRQQVLDLLKLLKQPSDILDIGAGFGNNCEPLLQHGHRLVATETNKEALRSLRKLAQRYPGQLTVISEPIELLRNNKKYDAIVCTMVLHFLTKETAHTAIEMMKRATRPGGYNVVVSYLCDQNLPSEYTYLLRPAELPSFYSDWKVISYEESYSLKFRAIRSAKQLIDYATGQKGHKSARIIAKNINLRET